MILLEEYRNTRRSSSTDLLFFIVSDLTSKSGFWAKALSERHAVLDSVLFFYVDAGGDVHYGLNGESKGVFMQGIDTRAPLWVLLDIYGNSTIVEFLDCRPQLNNNRTIARYGVHHLQHTYNPTFSAPSYMLITNILLYIISFFFFLKQRRTGFSYLSTVQSDFYFVAGPATIVCAAQQSR